MDVLASTLMVIIFVVLLFTVAQVYLGDLVVGKNNAENITKFPFGPEHNVIMG